MVAIGKMMIKFQLLEPTEHTRYSLHCNPSAREGGEDRTSRSSVLAGL